jgi:hypothetical protein
MIIDICPIGSVYRATLDFVDDDTGETALPDDLSITVIAPDRSEQVLEFGVDDDVQPTDTGYAVYVTPTIAGVYTVVPRGTGVVMASAFIQFLAKSLPTTS